MIIPGYEIIQALSSGGTFRYYRAVRCADNSPVLLKVLPTGSTDISEFCALKSEFEVAKRMRIEGIPKALDFIPESENGILVLEDLGGLFLPHFLSKAPLPLNFVLRVALNCADNLSRLHKQGEIHQNIQPINILIEEESKRIGLLGVCDPSRILFFDNLSRGPLSPQYMSPEQTGRTNCLVDHRTDFYSLGIVLYQMLAGKLPFQAETSLEWSHLHIAAKPPALTDLNPEVPSVLSEIVLKLMAKSAEDRYQSANGLHHDLRRCLNELEDVGQVSNFLLGQKDLPSRFELSQKLYGREAESGELARALDNTWMGQFQAVFISGSPGVGKTVLCQQLRQSILMRGGYFAASKADLIGAETPFGTILHACRDLVRHVLTEDEESLATYRQLLSDKLGKNLPVIVNSIPELLSILEVEEAQPVLGPVESKNRFHRCLLSFLQVFASKEHPLVMFLDDLHSADLSTLEAVETLLSEEISHFFLIGALRSEELQSSPQLSQLIMQSVDAGKSLEILPLASLTPKDTQQLLVETLQPTSRDSEALARLVYSKSAGNPFHLKALLSNLFDNQLLVFDSESGWDWDLSEIAQLEVSENVIALTAAKIKALPAITRWVIATAAMLGRVVAPENLATACCMELEEVIKHLVLSCQQGVLARTEQGFEFEHDQLKKSAYDQIPEDQRAETHLRVGRILAKSDAGNPDRIFDVVDHLNRSTPSLLNASECIEIAQLNFRAGCQARDLSSFPSAYQYFASGINFLGPNAWGEHYKLCLDLHSQATVAAFGRGDFDEVDRLADIIQCHASKLLDSIPVFEVQIAANHARKEEQKALSQCLEVLLMLGISIAEKPTSEDVDMGFLQLKEDVEAILALSPDALPLMTDPGMKAAMCLLVKAALIAGFVNDKLYNLMVCQLVKLTRQNGRSLESSVAMAMAGGLFSLLGEDYEAGQKIASYGRELCNLSPSDPWRPYGKFIVANDVESFLLQPQALFASYKEAHDSALERGDLTLASICAYFHSEAAFHSGMPLDQLVCLLESYLEESSQLKVERIELGLRLLRSSALHFIEGAHFESTQVEDQALNAWLENAGETVRFISLCHEMMSALITRNHSRIQKVLEQAEKLTVGAGVRGIVPFNYYLCLVLLDTGQRFSESERKRRFAIVERKLAVLQKRAATTPFSYQHRVDLVEALKHRALGNVKEAMLFFHRSIEGAQKSGYPHDEGLASEMAAEFYKEIDQMCISAMFYRGSAAAYSRWGANSCLERLYRRHLEVFSDQSVLPHQTGGGQNIGLGTFDMSAIESAGRALAGELDLSTLVKTLMQILLQNAGAERAALLIKSSGQLYVEALGNASKEVELFTNVKLESRSDFCERIIHSVSRSLEPIILGDAFHDPQFGADPHIQTAKIKSLFCSPIMHQGKPVAFLYLENSGIRDLFVGERLTVVKMISADAAIALQNARLTDDLKQEIKVRQETEEDLRCALDELSKLKKSIEADNLYLREEIKSSHNFDEIIGESAPLKAALNKVELVAPTDANVLILGETGTGKELIARAIHNRSQRKSRPLVKVNCAALPSTLIESELFGHEKGAFTGALERKIGRFELANGGTIFLDEIGDLPLELQAKLLRVLQEGEFERLGTSKTLKVDVRVIAATNRNLEEESAKGSFRSDLYYRLSVFPIEAPPLSKRGADIPILVSFFIAKYNKQLGKQIDAVSADTMSALENYSWPGNIRELQNVIERAMILSTGNTLSLDTSFQIVTTEKSSHELRDNSLDEAERAHILKILERCSWKISGQGNAADQLGLNPSTLRFRMGKLGIKRPS